jgi:hypothetical protein
MNWMKLLLAQRLIAVVGFCSVSFALSTRLAAQTAPPAQQVADAERIEWFQHDKFGMFSRPATVEDLFRVGKRRKGI